MSDKERKRVPDHRPDVSLPKDLSHNSKLSWPPSWDQRVAAVVCSGADFASGTSSTCVCSVTLNVSCDPFHGTCKLPQLSASEHTG